MKKQIPSPRRKSSFIAKAQAGFSLIELLVVIAVIGIIAAIAIPNIGNLTAGADKAKSQRNAQNLASVFSAARAAGNTDTFTDTGDAIAKLVDPGIDGAGTGTDVPKFQVPNISDDEQDLAAGFLNLQGAGGASQLIYFKDGYTATP